MERVREAIAFNVELADKSRWLLCTSESEQIGFPLRQTGGREHKERTEDLDSSTSARDHLVACHLAPAITDCTLDGTRKCCKKQI